jgi:hypothetical protein
VVIVVITANNDEAKLSFGRHWSAHGLLGRCAISAVAIGIELCDRRDVESNNKEQNNNNITTDKVVVSFGGGYSARRPPLLVFFSKPVIGFGGGFDRGQAAKRRQR